MDPAEVAMQLVYPNSTAQTTYIVKRYHNARQSLAVLHIGRQCDLKIDAQSHRMSVRVCPWPPATTGPIVLMWDLTYTHLM